MNTPIDAIIEDEDLTSLIAYVSSKSRPVGDEDYDRLENCLIKDWVSGFQIYSSFFPSLDRFQVDNYINLAWEYDSVGMFLYFLRSVENYDWVSFLMSRKHLEQHLVCLSTLLQKVVLSEEQIQILRAKLPEDSDSANAVSAMLETAREQPSMAQVY